MENTRMTTRSMTALTKRQEIAEVSSSQKGSSHINDAAIPIEKSTHQSSRHGKSSKASTAARLKIEAQIRADEKLAKILEQERIIIKNRLAFEKAKIDEEYSQSIDDEKSEEVRMQHDEQQSSYSKVQHWLHSNKSVHKNGNHSEKQTAIKKADIRNEEEALRTSMEMLLTRQCVDKELPIFSGEVKDWPFFYKQYESTTKMLNISQEENMCRLRKCLTGDARRAVEGLLISATSIDKIMDILKRRFGRSDLIVKHLVTELEQLPFIRNNDFKVFTHFAEKIANLVEMLELMDMPNYLECPQLMDKLLQKLPYSMQLSWGEKLCSSRSPMNLRHFSEWIWNKSEAASYVQTSNKPSFSNYEKPKYQSQTNEKYKSTFFTTKYTQRVTYFCTFCDEKGHSLEKCDKFSNLQMDEKWNFVSNKKLCFCCLKGSHRIALCTKKKLCDIDGCIKFHHKLLHTSISRMENDERPETLKTEIVAHTSSYSNKIVLLKTVPVTLRANGIILSIHALFDEAATVTLIDDEIANKLKIQGEASELGLRWTDSSSRKTFSSRKVNFEICGQDGQYYEMTNVYTMKDLDLPTQSVNVKSLKLKWQYLSNVYVQDTVPKKPKLLIGQDHWDLIVSRQVIEGPKNAPALSMTRLGWVVLGSIENFRQKVDETVLFIKNKPDDDLDDIHEQVKEYFNFESYGMKKEDEKLSEDDRDAEILIEKITRRVDGRWQCGLLFRDTEQRVAPNESEKIAFERLKYIEKKMVKDKKYANQYKSKINDYLEKGYCRRLSNQEIYASKNENVWYIPHFGVVNENKPNKIRFVFDAAAKVNGKCLNDFLLKGPDLYNSLVNILWRFRQKNITFSADIEEMFHKINIRREDQNCQRFLWRDGDRSGEPNVYVMQVMIFGVVSSPFSAQYVKNRNALEFKQEFPDAVDAIMYSHYMDDYLDSVNTENEAVKLVRDVINIHHQGGFKIRGWTTNSKELLSSIPEELRENVKLTSPHRILGLLWIPEEDTLKFSLNFNKVPKEILDKQIIPTKRDILKTIMSIFDPLGLLGIFTVRSKIILQEVWRSGINWDEKISEQLRKKWFKWLDGLQEIHELKIPWCYMKSSDDYILEQHAFCDASQQAVATTSYFRFSRGADKIVTLVTSRTQVAPIKNKTSIPKLELQAAVFACRIAKKVREEHSMNIERTFYWTDSKTVLCWIRNEPKKFKTFVSNRISEIQINSEKLQWRWVPSKLNVADDATRDDKEVDMKSDSRWYRGPDFLYLDEEQ